MVIALPSLTIARATLRYRTADSDAWVTLGGLGGKSFNVRNILFDGSLTFTRSNAGDIAKCSVRVFISGNLSVSSSLNIFYFFRTISAIL